MCRDVLVLGILAVLVLLMPTSLVGRTISFDASMVMGWDRYSLLPALGAVMVVVAILYRLRGHAMRLGLALLLIGASLVTHYQNASRYGDAWTEVRSLFWQLSWRAPQLAPGTVLIASFPDANTISESYHIGFPALLVYYPEDVVPQLTSQVINNGTADEIVLQGSNTEWTRTQNIPGIPGIVRDYSQALVVVLPRPGVCVHVIDGNAPLIPTGSDPLVRDIAPTSNIDQILVDAPFHVPPETIFGSELEHDWCYYYQSASLAAQRQDWEQVIQLGDEARSLGLTPNDVSEWWPFIQAYLYGGDLETALDYAEIIRSDSRFQFELCTSPGILDESLPVEDLALFYANFCR